MIVRRPYEALCGIGAALLGVVTLAYLIFGPLYTVSSSTGQQGSASMIQGRIDPLAWGVFALLLLGMLGVATGAVQHNRTATQGWRSLLWYSTLVLTILAILGLLSIGPFLLPAVALAMLACALSLRTRRMAAL